jgi:hypothetical protein
MEGGQLRGELPGYLLFYGVQQACQRDSGLNKSIVMPILQHSQH